MALCSASPRAAKAEQRIKQGIATPGEGVGVYTLVAAYNSIDRYRRLAGDLAKRGWTEPRLEKLFGGNFLRAYGGVGRVG